MTARRRALPLIPLCLLALAGCTVSAQESATSSQPPVLPATSQEPTGGVLTTSAAAGAISARDQSFGIVLPTGWVDDTAQQPSTVLYLKATQASHHVYASFTVATSVLRSVPSLDDLVSQGMIGQRQQGATVTKLANRTVGGAPAAGYALTRTSDGYPVSQTQYYVVKDNAVLITTMTAASADKASADRAQEELLGSWSWGAPPAPTTTEPSTLPPATDGAPSTGPSATAPGTPPPSTPAATAP